MLIEVNNNLFINAKNISFVRLKKNHLEFTELGNENLEEFEISDEGEKELREFFRFDEDFVEISSSQNEKQYINIKAVSIISVDEDEEDDDVMISIKLINDIHPWTETVSKENAAETISEIRKKIAKTKYVDHF